MQAEEEKKSLYFGWKCVWGGGDGSVNKVLRARISFPRIYLKTSGVMVPACDPNAAEAETGGSLELELVGQPI